MKLRTLRDLGKLRGERVLVRVDFNVPLSDGTVRDESRLWAALPTVQYLSARGAVVILLAHLGRPDGRPARELSLAPVARRFAQISGHLVSFVPDLGGERTVRALSSSVPGQVFMLENLRFDRGEESNSGSFAKRLAGLAAFYVNDAFGVSHRAHASVSAITRYLPAYAGELMERELTVLSHVRERPESPSVALIGGAKITTKIGLIKALASRFDTVMLGGGLANTVLSVRGFGVGASLLERGAAGPATQIGKLKNLKMPVDVLVAEAGKPGSRARVVPIAGSQPFVICRGKEAIVDIGPRTILAYASELTRAKTIVWNGPLGIFETPRFSHGTLALARVIAARSRGRALGVVGGGETVEAMVRTGMSKHVDHLSTGGGAMLAVLEGRTLPGVKPLYAGRAVPRPKKKTRPRRTA